MELGKVGSGLDVASIVSALVDADIAPKTNSLDRKQADIEADVSALGTLRASLDGLAASLAGLDDGSVFDSLDIKSPDCADIVQTGSVNPGSYSIEVSSLAASQVLASVGFASASTVVGTGTLTLSIGDPNYASGNAGAYQSFVADSSNTVSITIDDTNNTVSGIRDAINASAIGITCSLVVDGDNTRLLFTADDSGEDVAMSIAVDDDDGSDFDSSSSNTAGLSQLAYGIDSSGEADTFVGNVTEVRASADAAFTLNGLSLTNASNNIVGLVDGLDFTLKKVTSSAETILLEVDRAGIETKVKNFVDAYNSYQRSLSSLMDYKDEAGALAGDALARRIQSNIRSNVTGMLELSSNSYNAISDIGIESDRYGMLSFDASEFQAALSTDSKAVKTLFSGNTLYSGLSDNTDTAGLADKLDEVIDTYTNASTGLIAGRVDRLESALTDISDDRIALSARMVSLEERYTKQFAAMDTLVGQLQGTSDFLTNQMDALKAAANR